MVVVAWSVPQNDGLYEEKFNVKVHSKIPLKRPSIILLQSGRKSGVTAQYGTFFS